MGEEQRVKVCTAMDEAADEALDSFLSDLEQAKEGKIELSKQTLIERFANLLNNIKTIYDVYECRRR